ncbi:sulfatase-like hydrolase/transferase [Haladaptatus caseinilyticus]|uniref:sulfatase-like hydrolase/transferase n=1 Tax=Haladaptatus caseinilyticus TaxID=2993314 RepID=UPI00224AA157|nr:sulfatase-like hydrolase/transferase [Haladaptatus caseinilyticus]
MTNIAVVVLDTLRKDAFDKHFEWLPGKRFENAWSTSHWTVPAHGSLFTGKYASEAGVYRHAEMLNCDDSVLAERLRNTGYTTRAFSGNPNISRQFEFHRGFSQFEGSWRLQAIDRNLFDWDKFIAKTERMGPQRFPLALWKCISGDCSTVPSLRRGVILKLRDMGYGSKSVDDGAREALSFVQATEFGEQEFLFLNLMEAHSPYSAPEEYQTVTPPNISGLNATMDEPTDDPDRIRQAYDDEVRYLSNMYRRIFEELKKEFSVIITLSDHGELLGEHDAWEHMYGIYPELTHVPLCVYKGENDTTSSDETVSILDVHRTVLEVAKIDADSRGRDLRKPIEAREVLTEYHGLSDRHYYALKNNGYEDIDYLKTELRGFAKDGYYGHQTFDGFEEHGSGVEGDPRDRLKDLITQLAVIETRDDVDLSDSVKQQLEDLGYA